jgi:hypothetical protein
MEGERYGTSRVRTLLVFTHYRHLQHGVTDTTIREGLISLITFKWFYKLRSAVILGVIIAYDFVILFSV